MQHKKLVGSLLLLSLICAFSSTVYASEVTGNLSSTGASKNTTLQSGSAAGSGTSNNNDTYSDITGTMITAQGGSKSISGGGGSASASFDRADSPRFASSPSSSNLSSDGLALQSTSYILTEDYEGDPSSIAKSVGTAPIDAPAYNYLSSQAATPLGVFGQFSPSNWVWVALLGSLLLGTVIYMYGREKEGSYGF